MVGARTKPWKPWKHPRINNDKDVEILTPDNVRAMLTAAEGESHAAAAGSEFVGLLYIDRVEELAADAGVFS